LHAVLSLPHCIAWSIGTTMVLHALVSDYVMLQCNRSCENMGIWIVPMDHSSIDSPLFLIYIVRRVLQVIASQNI
jgi:hypothetical protein